MVRLLLLMFMPLAWAFISNPVDPKSKVLASPDVGNWVVGDCIWVQFAMEFIFDLKNHTFSLRVPSKAKVDKIQSRCGEEIQTLILSWKDISSNGTDLHRNLTLEFAKDNITNIYGVNRIHGHFDLALFQTKDEKNETVNGSSYVTIDSKEKNSKKLMFKVPLDRSFLCHYLRQDIELKSYLHYVYTGLNPPPLGYPLPNTKLVAKNMAFDAFRPSTAPKKTYQIPMDCDATDIIPIFVGIALISGVLFAISTHLFPKVVRRYRQYHYERI